MCVLNRICTCLFWVCFFFFNDTATTEIYTLSLHDALPISEQAPDPRHEMRDARCGMRRLLGFHASRIPHLASRQDRLSGSPKLRFMLFRERPFREPNIEARPALNGPQLDDSGRSAIDHIHE